MSSNARPAANYKADVIQSDIPVIDQELEDLGEFRSELPSRHHSYLWFVSPKSNIIRFRCGHDGVKCLLLFCFLFWLLPSKQVFEQCQITERFLFLVWLELVFFYNAAAAVTSGSFQMETMVLSLVAGSVQEDDDTTLKEVRGQKRAGSNCNACDFTFLTEVQAIRSVLRENQRNVCA